MGGLTSGAPWVEALRREAHERFQAQGYPSAKHEAWLNTDTGELERLALRPAPASAAPAAEDLPRPLESAVARLVFGNGRLVERRVRGELPEGVEAGSLAAAIDRDDARLRGHLAATVGFVVDHPLSELNAEHFADGAFIYVPATVAVVGPIELVFHSSPRDDRRAAVYPRVLIVAEPLSEATVAIRFGGAEDGEYLTNAVVEVLVKDGATVRLVQEQAEGFDARHVDLVAVEQRRDSRFESVVVAHGALEARSELQVSLTEPGASCRLDGLYLPWGDQRLDQPVVVRHRAPHTSSQQLYKGVLSDDSTGSFHGRVLISAGASGSQAHQHNANLLLGDNATANTRPQLEIDHDDVAASHGSTVGQLDPEALFYLASRGIPPAQARAVLTTGFAQEVLDRIPIREIAAEIAEVVADRLTDDEEEEA